MVTPVMRASGRRSPRSRENVGDRLAHRAFAGEIEPHAADLGLVHDVRRQDLRHDSRSPGQQGSRDDGGFLGIAGEKRGRDRNGIGRQQARELERVQPGASVPYCLRDDRAGERDVRLEILRQARRRRHQRFQCFPVANQVHKAAHGVGFGRVVRNAVSLEDRGHRIAAPDPHGEYRLRMDPPAAMRSRHRGDRFCRGLGRGERGRNVHHQDGIVLRVLEQRLERGSIAGGVRVACDVDRVRARPDRRQRGVEPFHGLRGDAGERSAKIGQPVDGEHANPTAIGEDGEALA